MNAESTKIVFANRHRNRSCRNNSKRLKVRIPFSILKLQSMLTRSVGGVPLAVICGEDELRQGKVKIKVMGAKEGDPEKDGILISRDNLVQEVRMRLEKIDKEKIESLTKKVEEVKVEG